MEPQVLQYEKVVRETDYFGEPFEPPEYRSVWVEPMSDG